MQWQSKNASHNSEVAHSSGPDDTWKGTSLKKCAHARTRTLWKRVGVQNCHMVLKADLKEGCTPCGKYESLRLRGHATETQQWV